MLYKSELKKIPPCPKPNPSKEELRDKTYIAGVAICEVTRCGKVLTIDHYSTSDEKLQVRFFSDGTNYVIYDCVNKSWFQKYITPIIQTKKNRYISKPAFATETDIKKAAKFLNQRTDAYFYSMYTGYKACSSTGITAVIDCFIQDKKREERDNAAERREAEFLQRRLWFKKYDNKIDNFCNRTAFKETYIFFSSFDKKHKRKYLCSYCGKKWSNSDTPKHKSETVCPHCHKHARFWAERYQTAIKDETTICTAQKHDGQLGLRWATVKRSFYSNKPKLLYCTDAYTFYLNKKGKNQIVSYFYCTAPYYYGYGWTKPRNGEICTHPAFVYIDNLNEAFGDSYYNVNLKEVLAHCKQKINFIKLLDNLKTIPQVEYLCKMDLTFLASQLEEADFNPGSSFEQIMGVTKQYLPMYKKLEVDAAEHRVLQSSKSFVTEETLSRLRKLKITESNYHRIGSILQYMTVETLCRYIENQAEICGKQDDKSHVLILLADYYDMCETLNIPINKHTVRPKNIKEEHDRLLPRYNLVIAEMKDKASREALEFVNNWFKGYKKGDLLIQVPNCRADFIREGQTLSHCVGLDRYYENHIKGKKMIFFIRKSDNPDEPYYTSEIDMVTFNVLQCYGFGDKAAPKAIMNFINGFAKWAKNQVHKKEVADYGTQENIQLASRCA